MNLGKVFFFFFPSLPAKKTLNQLEHQKLNFFFKKKPKLLLGHDNAQIII